jgi:hypothetical protein
MDFRVPDTLDSGKLLATDDSVDVEFAEFTGSLNDGAAPGLVDVPRLDTGSEAETNAHSEAEPVASNPPAWFRSIRKIRVADSGAQFRLTIKNGEEMADVSLVQKKTLTFTKPDGSKLDRDTRFYTDGSDGIIAYTTVKGDLDTEGDWSVQAFVDFGDSQFESETHSFVVHEPAPTPPPVLIPPVLIPEDSPKKMSRKEAIREERRRRKQAAIDLGLSEADSEEEPKNWREWLLRWLTGKEARSLVTSLAFHILLLICLSLILFAQVGENQAISMIMGEENTIPTLEEVDLSFETTGGEVTTAPQLQKIERESAESVLQNDLDKILDFAGTGEGTGGGEGFGMAFKMPTGGKAVTKGSFTAWTVPKDPRPGQDYKIVIQIQVPETIKRYRVADLSGRVIGTDKYTLDIPYEIQFNRYGTKIQKTRTGDLEFVRKGDYARVVDGQVQVVVNVEGAKQLVQDTIEVKSRMLKEEQKLEIVF